MAAVPSPRPAPPRSFHLFPQLPPEIRLHIWDLSLPSSRLIPIRCGSDPLPPTSKPAADRSPPPGCYSNAPIPASLHACAESRTHALSTRYSHALSFARRPGRVLLDHESDVLYFPPREGYMASSAQFHTCLSLCDQADLHRIRRVALHEDLFSCSLSCSRPPSPPAAAAAAADANAGWPPSYWSGLAVSLTTECLRRIADRMPAVEEVIFVCASRPSGQSCHGPRGDELDPQPLLVAQIQTAMADLAASLGSTWKPPRWTVVAEPR